MSEQIVEQVAQEGDGMDGSGLLIMRVKDNMGEGMGKESAFMSSRSCSRCSTAPAGGWELNETLTRV